MAEERIFLVETAVRTMRVTVPVGYKITYGPLIQVGDKSYGEKAVAMRVYRTEKDCIALIRDVLQFREVNGPVTVETLHIDNHAEESWHEDTDGAFSRKQGRIAGTAQALSGSRRLAFDQEPGRGPF